MLPDSFGDFQEYPIPFHDRDLLDDAYDFRFQLLGVQKPELKRSLEDYFSKNVCSAFHHFCDLIFETRLLTIVHFGRSFQIKVETNGCRLWIPACENAIPSREWNISERMQNFFKTIANIRQNPPFEAGGFCSSRPFNQPRADQFAHRFKDPICVYDAPDGSELVLVEADNLVWLTSSGEAIESKLTTIDFVDVFMEKFRRGDYLNPWM